MTIYDDAWVAREEAKRAWLTENGLYHDSEEHSSCGVGLVVALDGKASRRVVENSIAALKAVWHRGAVDADGKTGDGAESMCRSRCRSFTTRSAALAMNPAPIS